MYELAIGLANALAVSDGTAELIKAGVSKDIAKFFGVAC